MRGIYLSKEGKIFGPFTSEEIDRLRRKGEYALYSWLWEPETKGWVAINMPPPPPPIEVRLGKTAASDGKKAITAICHNNRFAVAGTLLRATDLGFTIQTNQSRRGMPPFGKGGKIWVDLLNEDSGRSETLPGVITSFDRREGAWEFHISWEKIPELIKELRSK